METERESDIGYIYRVSGPRKFSQFRKELTLYLTSFVFAWLHSGYRGRNVRLCHV
jgi:hypothetical protein